MTVRWGLCGFVSLFLGALCSLSAENISFPMCRYLESPRTLEVCIATFLAHVGPPLHHVLHWIGLHSGQCGQGVPAPE